MRSGIIPIVLTEQLWLLLGQLFYSSAVIVLIEQLLLFGYQSHCFVNDRQ